MIKHKKIIDNLLCIIAVLLPFFIILINLGIAQKSVIDFRPAWGDEEWWWAQANAVIEYGRPLGYWGYNGGTATIGTFATWGPAMVMPYALFGKIFGWSYHMYIWANAFYIGVATFIFIKLTKISKKGLILLIICNFLVVVKNYYLMTAMAECVRYSIAICGVALLWYLYEHPNCHWGIKYVFIPIFLIYCTQAYLILGIYFFFYILCVLRKKGKIVNILLSTVGSLVFVFVNQAILNMIGTPYISGGSKSGLIDKILNGIYIIKSIFYGTDVFFKAFFILYFFLIISTAIYLISRIHMMPQREIVIYCTSFFVLCAFFGGHILFYSTMTTWTFVRGLTVGVIIVLFLLSLSDKKSIVLAYMVLAIIVGPTYDNVQEVFFAEDRFQTEEWCEKTNKNKQAIEEILIINEQATDPWENTVAAYYESGLQLALILPRGFAINTMMNGSTEIEAKYAIVGKIGEDWENTVVSLEQNGYDKSLNNEYMIILVRNVELLNETSS